MELELNEIKFDDTDDASDDDSSGNYIPVPYIDIAPDVNDLVSTNTYYGNIQPSLFQKIQKILRQYFCPGDTTTLREFMLSQKYAPIRKNGKLITDLKHRKCLRHTFRGKPLEQLIELLSPCFTKFIKNPFRLDSSHADILFYEENGVFKKHCDKVSKLPDDLPNDLDPKKWNFYSLIVGLDSSSQFGKYGNGNTIVWTIPNESVHKINKYELDMIVLQHHSFPIKKHQFLLFPSTSRHEVQQLSTNQFSIKLKIDMWIYSSAPSPSLTTNLRCNCQICEPHLTYFQKKTLFTLKQKGLSKNLLLMINNYYDFLHLYNPRCDKKYHKYCCCERCIDQQKNLKHGYSNGNDNRDWYGDYSDYSEDDYCNGYEERDWNHDYW